MCKNTGTSLQRNQCLPLLQTETITMVSVAYRICLKKKKVNADKYARKSVQTAITGDQNTPRELFILQINMHAFFLCTEFLKVVVQAVFFFLKWAREIFENMTWQKYFQLSQGREAEFLLRLTRRQHVRNNGNGGGEEG